MQIDRKAVYKKYDGHCAYCGNTITLQNFQVDHIVPISRYKFLSRSAKFDFDVNQFSNLNPSCRACNYYKHADGIETFRKNIKTLHVRFTRIFIVRLAIKYGIITVKEWDGLFYFEKIKTSLNKSIKQDEEESKQIRRTK